MLKLAVVAVLAAAVTGVVAASPAARAGLGPGSFTKNTHPGIGGTGPRDYWVYEPTVPPDRPRPLVVFLHGCLQTGRDAAIGTRWNELAERRGFVVVYPEQSVAANGTQCWNWFMPDHQRRDTGEPAVITAITRSVVATAAVDPKRVYVFGVSAGANMATIVAATHPDVFAAHGALAGCPFSTCADLTGAQAHAAMGPRARVVPAFIVQGTIDALNNFAMGEALVRQWIGTSDRADNGSLDGSVPAAPSSVEHRGFDASLLSGAGTVGDTCVRNRQWPCVGAVAGWGEYPHTIERHATADGCSVVDFWILHGLGHDYPYGDPAGTYTDAIGPDITTAAYDFFTRHALGSGPCAATAATSAPAGGPADGSPDDGAADLDPGRPPAVALGAPEEHPATGPPGPGSAPVVATGVAAVVLGLLRIRRR